MRQRIADLKPDVHIDLFDYHLPQERIAQSPCEPRDQSRLLVVGSDSLNDHTMLDLPSQLDPGDLLIVNDTRVIPARLTGKRGLGSVQLTLHKPVGDRDWIAFAKPAKKCRTGDVITLSEQHQLAIIENLGGGEVHVRFGGQEPIADILDYHGNMPLPPYIRRAEGDDAASDRDSYQTVFASKEGAVAAPTAGLHFTPRLLNTLETRGIGVASLTLHVGAGTFLPVKVDNVSEHRMHEERYSLRMQTVEQILQTKRNGGKVISVGTTVTRTLEAVHQKYGELRPDSDSTDIFITPGFTFRTVDRLLTNFHLPKSTLLMLVSAFSGRDRMLQAYNAAIARKYRFFSYGDACLLSREEPSR